MLCCTKTLLESKAVDETLALLSIRVFYMLLKTSNSLFNVLQIHNFS